MMGNEAKPVVTMDDILASVTLIDEATGKPVTSIPDGGKLVVKRVGQRVIPIQQILRDLRAKFPDAVFTFGAANVILKQDGKKKKKA
jgi:hypothetical protein